MVNDLCFWFVAYSSTSQPVGGLKQLHRACEFIKSLGYKSYLIQNDESFRPDWFKSSVNTISKTRWLQISSKLDKLSNILVIPETYLPLAVKHHYLPKIIFNQNASYTFSSPKSSRFYKIPVAIDIYKDAAQVWCVSAYDFDLLFQYMGIEKSRIFRVFNSLDSNVVEFPACKRKKIAYMPRKNSKHALTVVGILSSLVAFEGWEFVPIHKVDQSRVFDILSEAAIFLSFGHPEGFGLPVAEAMSLGCLIIGYTGLGGKELFEIGEKHGTAWAIEFGDILSFINAAQKALCLFDSSTILSSRLEIVADIVRSKYNDDAMRLSLANAIKNLRI